MKCLTLPVTHFQQNCSLLWCENTLKAAVIDPGADVAGIVAALKGQGLTLEKVLLTHGHLDHAGAAAELAQQMQVPILGPHKADAFWLDQLAEQAQMMGFPPADNLEPDQWLQSGDRIQVGDLWLDVLHTPGHTPGHVCFFDSASRSVWVGDLLFVGSVGRTDFPMSDSASLIHSCRHVLFPLGDDVQFYPGHGPAGTLGRERLSNPFVGNGA